MSPRRPFDGEPVTDGAVALSAVELAAYSLVGPVSAR